MTLIIHTQHIKIPPAQHVDIITYLITELFRHSSVGADSLLMSYSHVVDLGDSVVGLFSPNTGIICFYVLYYCI